MKKKRVYIDVFYYKNALSGLKTYIEELVSAINNHGSDDIEYIFSHDIHKIINNQFFVNSKFRLIRWLFQLRYFLWKQITLPLKLLILKADLVVCPDYIAPMLTSSRKIVVVHDNLIWKYPRNYSFFWRKYYTKLISFGINSKTKIITTSNYSKEGLKLIFPNNKIFPIYQSSEALSNNENNFNTKKYILHIGTFEKRKDLLTLIRAFKKLRDELKVDCKLVLAGSTSINGNNYVFLKIQKYIFENKLSNSVLIPGYIDKSKVIYFFSNALMYVFPSLDEGFGIPLIEALKFKVPVICSNIPIFKEIAKDSVLYFDKKDEFDLSQKMKKLIQNKNLSNKLVLKGEERVKKFNRHNFIKDFEKIF